MLARWSSRHSCLIVLILFAAAGPQSAAARRICVDPGHGGTALGAALPACAEKNANLNVSKALDYLLSEDLGYLGTFATRYTDETVSIIERIIRANNGYADAFISLHHNAFNNHTLVEYDTQGQQTFWWGQSQNIAYGVSSGLYTRFCYYYSVPFYGVCEDVNGNCSGSHLQVLQDNPRPAVLGEALAMWTHPEAYKLCRPLDYPMAFDEAKAYFYGVHQAYGTTPVGVTFAAQNVGPGAVRLTWEEDDPSRLVAYVITRRDDCWGPFEYVAAVYSQDPAYTPDNRHYTFNTTVQYDRDYVFKLSVMDESPRATAAGDGASATIFVGQPSNLQATGVDLGDGRAAVNLTWTPSAGQVAGYYVWRAMYEGMTSCDDRREYLGTTATTSYADSSASSGVPLFYRVRAFNATTGSVVSGQATVNVQQVVDVVEEAGVDREGILEFGPNPTKVEVRMAYMLKTPGNVRMRVFDVAGRVVAEPIRDLKAAGLHRDSWDGRGLNGRSLRAGVYFARLSVDGRQIGARRLVVVR